VTFISTGAISFSGNPTVNLSATTSDTYVGSADVKGILFWDTSTSTSKITGEAAQPSMAPSTSPKANLTTAVIVVTQAIPL